MLRRVRFGVAALVLLATSVSPVLAMPPAVDFDEAGEPIHPICPTEDIWQQRRAELGMDDPLFRATCPTEGVCDDPAIRDAADTQTKTISVIVHVITDSNGNTPSGLTQADIDAQMAEINADYSQSDFQFQLTATRYHADDNYYCISQYSPFNSSWYNEILNMKATYAEDPANNLNIFVTCQDQSRWGTLLGIATFPWDPAALTSTGGLWLNSDFTGAGNKTASHEIGHCLGLWHTHHGVSETDGCTDACYENTHAIGDPAADLVGDFCADTPPTPTNYTCSAPDGTDCNGVSWGATQPENIMGYGPDTCIDLFTTNQSSRMHCWTDDVLAGWLVDGGTTCEATVPAAPSGLTVTTLNDSQVQLDWTDNSADEEGFIVSRDGVDIANVGADVVTFTDGGLDCETSYTYAVRAQNCAGESSGSSATGTTGTCPAGPTLSVASIDLSLRSRGPWTNAEGSVLVVDQNGAAVGGATVTASWSGSASGTQSAITGSDGRAFFESDRTRSGSYCFTLTVDGVSLSGATYDAAGNVETSDSAGNACSSRVQVARDEVPTRAMITGVRPNPFNPRTEIFYFVPATTTVELAVYDVSGRRVATLVRGTRPAGEASVTWNGKDAMGRSVASGVYLAKMVAGGETITQRMTLLK